MKPASRNKIFHSRLLLIAFVIIVGLSACKNRIWLAHRYNEKGLSADKKNQSSKAHTQYELSINYHFLEKIPLFNMGNSYFRQKNYTAAHRYFEEALSADTEFTEALYNDGETLYYWGAGHVDRDYCNIDRTVLLWEKAIKRFNEVEKNSGRFSSSGRNARVNREFIKKRITEIQKKHHDNRKKCEAKKNNEKRKGGNKDEKDKKKKSTEGNQKQKEKNKNQKNKDKSSQKQNREKDKDTIGSNALSTPNRHPTSSRLSTKSLSAEERDKVRQALSRIKKEAGNHSFYQTSAQQLRKGKGRKNVGEHIYR